MAYTAEYIYNSGHAFWHAAHDIDCLLIVPRIINISLSAELFLKSIVFLETNSPVRGHNLCDFFNSTKDDTKNVIYGKIRKKLETNDPDNSIHDQIKKVSEAFIEWRYIYEAQSIVSINTNFLKVLAEALMEILQERNPGWSRSGPQIIETKVDG